MFKKINILIIIYDFVIKRITFCEGLLTYSTDFSNFILAQNPDILVNGGAIVFKFSVSIKEKTSQRYRICVVWWCPSCMHV